MLRPYPLEPPPPLPPLDGDWEGAEVPVVSGRRARLDGGRVAFGGALRVHRMQVGSGHGRWLVGREEPCFVWEIHGEGRVAGSVELILGEGEFHVERSEDGATFWFGGAADRSETLLGVTGGRGTVTELSDGARIEVEGSGRLRVLVVGASDATDRDRALRSIARKGLGGLQAQWRRHFAQLEALRIRIGTPEADRDASLRTLAVDEESAVAELPAGRCILADPVRSGGTLLALGLREPVRDVLRAPLDDPRLLELFALYAHWAGADEFVQKHWPRVMAAHATSTAPPVFAQLLPVAEALGEGSRFASIGPVEEGGPAIAIPVPDAVQGLWGIVPEALDGACTFAPALPRTWREMELARCRVGASTVDLRVVRRPAGLAVKCRRTHGPALVVHLRPRLDFTPTGVLLNDHQFPGTEVAVTVGDEIEALWLT